MNSNTNEQTKQMSAKKVLMLIGGGIAFCVALLAILIGFSDSDEEIYTEKLTNMEMALAQNDFETARAMAIYLDRNPLVGEARYESELHDKYQSRVLTAELTYLISECEFDLAYQIANENKADYSCYKLIMKDIISIYDKFGADTTLKAVSVCASIGSSDLNEDLASLMEYMKMQGDDSYKKVAFYLDDSGWNKEEAAEIKKKLGIK